MIEDHAQRNRNSTVGAGIDRHAGWTPLDYPMFMFSPALSTEHRRSTLPARGQIPLYYAARYIALASWIPVLWLLVRVNGHLVLRSALLLSGLVGVLWGTHCFYRHRPGAGRLAVAPGVLAILLASGAAAGAISQLGLALRMPLIDLHLANADRAIGFSSHSVIAYIVEWPGLSCLLGIAYLSSFPLLICSALILATGSEERAWELTFVFASAIVFAAICAALFPAEGAFRYLNVGPELTDRLPPGSGVYHLAAMDYFRNATSIRLDVLALQGVVTFPSFHTALALMTAFVWRNHRRIYYPMIGWNGLVIISTIPIGGHYGVDLIGGALLWAALALIGVRLAYRAR